MFYVPETLDFPREKYSLRIIAKLEDSLRLMRPAGKPQAQTPAKSASLRQRFKTMTEEVERPKKVTLPCRIRNSSIALPRIGEKLFFIEGKVTGLTSERNHSFRRKESTTKTERKGSQARKRAKKTTSKPLKDCFVLQPWKNEAYEELGMN